MNLPVNVHRYGPAGDAAVLAVHGLTGHGQRWQAVAEAHLPDVPIVAPDLLGHGRSPSSAPWTIEANVAALAEVLEQTASEPVVVVGHSFGGAVALHLAAAHPDRVRALVLLDPAAGLDGEWMRQIAEAMFASPDYTDRAEARSEKRNGSWGEVDDALLEAELDEHLVDLPNGRVGWRIFIPAMLSYWSELARDIVFPTTQVPVTLVRATRTSPPYVTTDLVDGLRNRLGSEFTLVDIDCDHMVAQARPAETAELIRSALGG